VKAVGAAAVVNSTSANAIAAQPPDAPANSPDEGARAAIQAAGAQIRHLPPNSPDLNPIEQMFAKLKALLRKIAARSPQSPGSFLPDPLRQS